MLLYSSLQPLDSLTGLLDFSLLYHLVISGTFLYLTWYLTVLLFRIYVTEVLECEGLILGYIKAIGFTLVPVLKMILMACQPSSGLQFSNAVHIYWGCRAVSAQSFGWEEHFSHEGQFSFFFPLFIFRKTHIFTRFIGSWKLITY